VPAIVYNAKVGPVLESRTKVEIARLGLEALLLACDRPQLIVDPSAGRKAFRWR
jgi:hypothetical protein